MKKGLPFVTCILLVWVTTIRAACPPDGFNSSLTNHANFDIPSSHSLSMCDEVEDFWGLNINKKGILTVNLTFPIQIEFGLRTDLDLFIVDENNTFFFASSETATPSAATVGNEILAFDVNATSVFLLSVFSFNGFTNATYDLNISLIENKVACFTDELTNIGTPTITTFPTQFKNISICNGFSRRFSLNLTSEVDLVTTLTFPTDDPQFKPRLLLLRSDGTVAINALEASSPKTIKTKLGPGQFNFSVQDTFAWFGAIDITFDIDRGAPSNVVVTPKPEGVPLGAIIGGVIAAVIAVLIISAAIIVIVVMRKKLKKKSIEMKKIEEERTASPKLQIDIPAPPPGDTSGLIIDFRELKGLVEIGRGSYGVVYKAAWGNSTVAVKQLHEHYLADNTTVEDFKREALLLKNLRHPNIVLMWGLTQPPQPFTIVTAFCANGSLFEYLRRPIDISYLSQLQILLDVACGMEYLHKHRIIHRDLAARNILLSEDFRAQLSDFGFSRSLDPSKDLEGANKTKAEVGPLKWMAPEAIRAREYSVKTDVWSFGVVICEIVERDEPYKNLDSLQVALQVGNYKLRPELPSDSQSQIFLSVLVSQCCELEAKARPMFAEIFPRIQEELKLHKKMSGNFTEKSIRTETVGSNASAGGFIVQPEISVNLPPYNSIPNNETPSQISKMEPNTQTAGELYAQMPSVNMSLTMEGDAKNSVSNTNTTTNNNVRNTLPPSNNSDYGSHIHLIEK